MTRFLGGDGSEWLSDMAKDEDMKPEVRKSISNLRTTHRDTRNQQAMNRLAHARWPHEAEPSMQISWPWAVAIAFVLVVVFCGQFGG